MKPIRVNNRLLQKTAHKALVLSWQDNLPVQRLLDVIASIIAHEYVETAKAHPELFTRLRHEATPRQEGGE